MQFTIINTHTHTYCTHFYKTVSLTEYRHKHSDPDLRGERHHAQQCLPISMTYQIPRYGHVYGM